MSRRTFILVLAFLAWEGSAQVTARKPEAYLPKNALYCERAVTSGSANKNCRSCNQEATVGADSRITLQVGGCTSTPTELRAAEFTQTGIQFFKALTATGLTTSGPNVLGGSTSTTGPLTSSGPNTFNGLTTIANLAVTNAPIQLTGFIPPKGTVANPHVAPAVAIRFGTAGLYFFYSPDLVGPSTPYAPDAPQFGANAVTCAAGTYGSIAVNTALFGSNAPAIWICAYTTVGGGSYDWQAAAIGPTP